MNILIIGLGYAGDRYRRAFLHVSRALGAPLRMAYVDRQPRPGGLPRCSSVSEALSTFRPEIVVVSVNDGAHVAVLRELQDYTGFVLCEKPLATPGDDWQRACEGLRRTTGFALDLVERYSAVTERLRHAAAAEGWREVRASFHWGKNRINDHRPTCGVTSEAIHAIDLVSWVTGHPQPIQVDQAIGIHSDFSISGNDIPDTLLLTGSCGPPGSLATAASSTSSGNEPSISRSSIRMEG